MVVGLLHDPANRALLPNHPHRFSVAQYHEMVRSGILTSGDRVELLAGWIVDKMPQNPIHSATLSILRRELAARLSPEWIIGTQCPITLSDSEPEPDLAIVLGPEENYLAEHPGSDDTAIAIEISDSSLEDDRTRKQAIYAAARIPIYWIVNVVDFKVEVYRLPRAGRQPKYREKREYGLESSVSLSIKGREMGSVNVRNLFATG